MVNTLKVIGKAHTVDEVARMKEIRKGKQIQHRNHKLMEVQATKRSSTRMYLSNEAQRELLMDCTDRAVILHTMYVNQAEETSCELTDEYMTKITGWNIRSVMKYRVQLEKAHWFKKHRTSIVGSKEFAATFYLLDKDTVLKYMSTEDFEEYLDNP